MPTGSTVAMGPNCQMFEKCQKGEIFQKYQHVKVSKVLKLHPSHLLVKLCYCLCLIYFVLKLSDFENPSQQQHQLQPVDHQQQVIFWYREETNEFD